MLLKRPPYDSRENVGPLWAMRSASCRPSRGLRYAPSLYRLNRVRTSPRRSYVVEGYSESLSDADDDAAAARPSSVSDGIDEISEPSDENDAESCVVSSLADSEVSILRRRSKAK